jgi:predicted nucleotide-binding protein (sugar kinase/HSP70/actin superfamily)
LREAAPTVLEWLRERGEPILLVLGRPYNLFDGGANLELPRKIADHGLPLLPMDLAPWHGTPLSPAFQNVFWTYGQDLLRALRWVRDQPDVHPIWFTNFKCGPDSFLLSYGEAILGEKPFLALELDEHGGDAGYMTRVEAFLDVVRQRPAPPRSFPAVPGGRHSAVDLRDRRIWLPPMHPLAARFVAAAFRSQGFDAESLPLEDEASLDVGRSVTRGGECLPLTLTLGRLLSRLREGDGDGRRHAFFLPHACGPCRFGCYELLQRLVLEREGFGDVAFLTPSNDNAYQGLGESLRRASWLGILSADVLFKVACRFRPYERVPGTVDGLMDEVVEGAIRATEAGVKPRTVLASALASMRRLGKPSTGRPLVGIVGEIYVRCNPMANQDLVRSIEAAGGEAWLSPFSEWMLFACYEHERRGRQGWDILGQTKAFLKNRYLFETERIWYQDAGPLLADRHEPSVETMVEAARPYASYNFGGETQLVVGRAVCFAREGAGMVVNCSPFGCLPGALMTGLFNEVQRDLGVPIVNLFYDGAGDLNRRVAVFLRNLDGAGTQSAKVAGGDGRAVWGPSDGNGSGPGRASDRSGPRSGLSLPMLRGRDGNGGGDGEDGASSRPYALRTADPPAARCARAGRGAPARPRALLSGDGARHAQRLMGHTVVRVRPGRVERVLEGLPRAGRGPLCPLGVPVGCGGMGLPVGVAPTDGGPDADRAAGRGERGPAQDDGHDVVIVAVAPASARVHGVVAAAAARQTCDQRDGEEMVAHTSKVHGDPPGWVWPCLSMGPPRCGPAS